MIVKEYRLVLPMTVEEYQVGQLWSVAEASKAETGGGEGVEVLKNEPFKNYPLLDGRYSCGQYTHKIYHLQTIIKGHRVKRSRTDIFNLESIQQATSLSHDDSQPIFEGHHTHISLSNVKKVPTIVRTCAPKGSLAIHEEAWNAYPYCKTVLTNPDYMRDDFFIHIETIHLPDRGTTQNAHNLSPEDLAKREVIDLDIANDTSYLTTNDIRPETTPSKFKSLKTGRGPLVGNWKETMEPVMCAYKLVKVHFKWFGLTKIVENYAHRQYPRLFTKFHREVFCWLDNWYGLTMADIREIEDKAQKELEEARINGPVRGMMP